MGTTASLGTVALWILPFAVTTRPVGFKSYALKYDIPPSVGEDRLL